MIHCTSQLAMSNHSETDHTRLGETLLSTQATGAGGGDEKDRFPSFSRLTRQPGICTTPAGCDMRRCARSIAMTMDQAGTIDLKTERVKKKCSDFEGSEHVTSKAFVLCLKASHSKKGGRGGKKKTSFNGR